MTLKAYKRATDLFEKGVPPHQVRSKLYGQGFSRKEVNFAIEEYYKDTKHSYDEKLISYIEKRLDAKVDLLTVYDELSKKGHSAIEINKAVMRAKPGRMKITDITKKWFLYSIIQFLVLITLFVLSTIVSFLFFIEALILMAELAVASFGMHNNKKKWVAELTVIPGMNGVGYTCGYFGYNPSVGNYFRWWVVDPRLVTSAMFIFFIILGTLGKNNLFVLWNVALFVVVMFSFLLMPNEPRKEKVVGGGMELKRS